MSESANDFDIHKLNDLRRRILAGEEYSDEELAAAIAFRRHQIREQKLSEAAGVKKPSSKRKSSKVDLSMYLTDAKG